MAKQKTKQKNNVQVLAVIQEDAKKTKGLQKTKEAKAPAASGAKRGGLSKDLGAKAPSKQQINLIKKEVKTTDTGKKVALIALVAVVLLVAAGYTFLRWQTVSSLRREARQLDDQLVTMRAASADYDKIYKDYIRYSTGYETSAEKKMQDSRILIDKVRELVEPYGFITNINVDGNTLQVTVYSKDISQVTDSLNNDPDKLVTMVIPMTENKDRESAGQGPQSPGGQSTTPPSPDEQGEQGEQGEQPAQDSGEVDNKVLVESMSIFKLIFEDKDVTAEKANAESKEG